MIPDIDRRFSAEPQDLAVHLGEVAMFPCRIGGQPTPHVRWFKDELEISSDGVNYHFHRDGVLEIRNVQFSDFSRYKCRVDVPGDGSRTSTVAQLRQDSDISKYS